MPPDLGTEIRSEVASSSIRGGSGPGISRPAFPAVPLKEELVLNEPSLSIRGGTVRLEALLDMNGLIELESQIQALKTLLKRKAPESASRD